MRAGVGRSAGSGGGLGLSEGQQAGAGCERCAAAAGLLVWTFLPAAHQQRGDSAAGGIASQAPDADQRGTEPGQATERHQAFGGHGQATQVQGPGSGRNRGAAGADPGTGQAGGSSHQTL